MFQCSSRSGLPNFYLQISLFFIISKKIDKKRFYSKDRVQKTWNTGTLEHKIEKSNPRPRFGVFSQHHVQQPRPQPPQYYHPPRWERNRIILNLHGVTTQPYGTLQYNSHTILVQYMAALVHAFSPHSKIVRNTFIRSSRMTVSDSREIDRKSVTLSIS